MVPARARGGGRRGPAVRTGGKRRRPRAGPGAGRDGEAAGGVRGAARDRAVDRVVNRASEAERAFAAAWWVVDDLVRFGMEQATVSPGSRSTPLALALARHPHVRLHVHLDERASGFFALGIAKATGRPVAVACTSGTARRRTPSGGRRGVAVPRDAGALDCRSAARSLRGVGANQTIDQVGLFGGYVRASIDAPVPGDATDEQAWHDLVLELTRASMGLPPGPVHLNLPFREPLVGAPQVLPASPPSGTEFTLSSSPEPEETDALERELTSTTDGLILAGSMRESPPTLPELAVRAGWLRSWPSPPRTSACRARSPGRFVPLADARFANEHVPDVVVQFGAAPTSRVGLELVRRAGRLVIVDQDHLVADPHLQGRLDPPPPSRAWLRARTCSGDPRWRGERLAPRVDRCGRARSRKPSMRRSTGGTNRSRAGSRATSPRSVPDRGTLVVGSSNAGARPRRLTCAPRRHPGPCEPRGERDRRVRLDRARGLGRRAPRRRRSAAISRCCTTSAPDLERAPRVRLRVRRAEQRRRRDLLVPPAARPARVRGAVRDAARARARRDLPSGWRRDTRWSSAPPT